MCRFGCTGLINDRTRSILQDLHFGQLESLKRKVRSLNATLSSGQISWIVYFAQQTIADSA